MVWHIMYIYIVDLKKVHQHSPLLDPKPVIHQSSLMIILGQQNKYIITNTVGILGK